MQSTDQDPTPPRAAVTLGHAHLEALETYWRSLGADRGIPARTDLNPAQIETVLPYAFILQRVAAGTARFRVAGQRVHDLLKMDPRGMPFSTLFQPEDHQDLRHLLESAFQDPAIVGLPLRAPGGLVRPALDAALLMLPMRDNAGDTSRLLGALVTPDHPALKPHRFAIRRDIRSRHERLATPGPALVPLMSRQLPREKGPNTPKRPALRLVVNNG